MLKQSNKYSICHPLTTPEFFIPKLYSSSKLKSLALYSQFVSPDVIYETPYNAIDYIFGSKTTYSSVAIHPNYHMYVKDYPIASIDKCNVLATKLYRLSSLTTYGIKTHRSIYGDVLIFGSVSPVTKLNDGYDYSVPYELIEQLIRIYKSYV